ncbi:MAG: phage replisome organizer N-terminal domain-containing protein [Dehalococcoidia bacterium]
MGNRTWIRIFCDKWLEGTLREEAIEIRGVWIDLLALAGAGRYGDSGEIKLANGIGLTDRQFAEILGVSLRLWKRAKCRFENTDRIKVSKTGAISITNWSKYQSEYQRQKPLRERQRAQQDGAPGKHSGRNPRDLPTHYTDPPDYPDLD